MPHPPPAPRLTPAQRRRAILQVVIGWGQMFGAATGFLLLVTTGPSRATIAVTIATACLLVISRLVFHGKRVEPSSGVEPPRKG